MVVCPLTWDRYHYIWFGMIDFMQVMLAVVDEYKRSLKPVYIWVNPGGTQDSWAINGDRDALGEPPTFVFAGQGFDVYGDET